MPKSGYPFLSYLQDIEKEIRKQVDDAIAEAKASSVRFS